MGSPATAWGRIALPYVSRLFGRAGGWIGGRRGHFSLLAGGYSLIILAGCSPVETRFEVLSFKDHADPKLYGERFPDGVFAETAHKNTTLVFEIHPEEQSADELAAPQDGHAQPAQIVRVEVFWKPRPGTTHAERSQTNANIAYCLITGRDAVSYEGAGFVYCAPSRDGKTMTGRIESSILVPAHVVGEPNDLFGPCHLTGTFCARQDRKKVVAAEQRLRRCTAASKPGP
jgi:hypothetical protein